MTFLKAFIHRNIFALVRPNDIKSFEIKDKP